jgi:hypothetical protein
VEPKTEVATPFKGKVWVTFVEAASICAKHRSQISRARASGKLQSNGRQWRDARACLWSVLVAAAAGIEKLVRWYGHWERRGDEKEILALAGLLKQRIRGLGTDDCPRVLRLARRLCEEMAYVADRFCTEVLAKGRLRRYRSKSEFRKYELGTLLTTDYILWVWRCIFRSYSGKDIRPHEFVAVCVQSRGCGSLGGRLPEVAGRTQGPQP